MWRCVTCREQHRDGFEVCWRCGTSKDGVPDPTFQREGPGDEGEPAVDDAPSEEDGAEDAPLSATGVTTAPPRRPAGLPAAASPPAVAAPEPEHRVALALVLVFRGLAGVVGLFYLVLLALFLEMAHANGSSRSGQFAQLAALLRLLAEGVVTVAALLAVGEFLRLGVALERNTRRGRSS